MNIEISLLQQQRTYQQAQQGKLIREAIQKLVEIQNYKNPQIQQFAPTLPVFVKMKKKWAPRSYTVAQSPSTIPRPRQNYIKLSETIAAKPKRKMNTVSPSHENTPITTQRINYQVRMPVLRQQRQQQLQRKIKFSQVTLAPW
ncbi:hypothetical protein pb186bvf_010210 [Paramecium bursaria]